MNSGYFHPFSLSLSPSPEATDGKPKAFFLLLGRVWPLGPSCQSIKGPLALKPSLVLRWMLSFRHPAHVLFSTVGSLRSILGIHLLGIAFRRLGEKCGHFTRGIFLAKRLDFLYQASSCRGFQPRTQRANPVEGSGISNRPPNPEDLLVGRFVRSN